PEDLIVTRKPRNQRASPSPGWSAIGATDGIWVLITAPLEISVTRHTARHSTQKPQNSQNKTVFSAGSASSALIVVANRFIPSKNRSENFEISGTPQRSSAPRRSCPSRPLDNRKEPRVGFFRQAKGATWRRTEETSSRARS